MGIPRFEDLDAETRLALEVTGSTDTTRIEDLHVGDIVRTRSGSIWHVKRDVHGHQVVRRSGGASSAVAENTVWPAERVVVVNHRDRRQVFVLESNATETGRQWRVTYCSSFVDAIESAAVIV